MYSQGQQMKYKFQLPILSADHPVEMVSKGFVASQGQKEQMEPCL
jgi:hypothetical protein